MKRNDELLQGFLSILPSDLCHVFEFRHQSWLNDEVFQILQQHNIGFCAFDMPDFTTPVVATAHFAYIRFHGSSSLYGSCYSDQDLEEWGKKILDLGQGLEAVYIYFNNDAEAFAVRNAKILGNYLSAV
jgi:uncharacterized protein YecE (DUF72 family)